MHLSLDKEKNKVYLVVLILKLIHKEMFILQKIKQMFN